MAAESTRLRIVSDGTPRGTKVLLPTGEALPGVTKVTWQVEASMKGHATATVTLHNVAVEAEGIQVPDDDSLRVISAAWRREHEETILRIIQRERSRPGGALFNPRDPDKDTP